jgi:hypothetical protein
MNNMLLSSALSSKAIEETGGRRELLLVNPVDGSDLVRFSAPSLKIRGTAAASFDSAERHHLRRASGKSKRTTARCASPRCRRAPRATA